MMVWDKAKIVGKWLKSVRKLHKWIHENMSVSVRRIDSSVLWTVIAILCWSCCRFVETTCMFLYLTVVQRTGSELEVVWFLMSDCISNQPALTTDRNRSVSGQKQIKLLLLRQSSTLWLVLLISVGDTFLKLFIQVDLSRSSWQPYTYKK